MDIPTIITSFQQHHAIVLLQPLMGLSFQGNIMWFNYTL